MHRSLTWSLLASGLLIAACGGDGNSTDATSADDSTTTTGSESTTESSTDESGTESTETGDPCVEGTEACPCTAEETCDEGLTCISGFCVEYTPYCGDGILQDGEQCDNGALNADDGICKTDCTIQTCGDGHVGPGEACDDGNTDDTDGCNNQCHLPSCGNGVVEGDEECDDGNADDTDACPTTCLNAVCGDTFVYEGTEDCDDANGIDDDGCSNACEAQPKCGDGIKAVGELCFLQPIGITVLGGPVDIEAIEIAKPDDTPGGSIDLVVTVNDHLPDDDGDNQSGVRILRGDNAGSFIEFARKGTGFPGAVDAVVGDINLDGDVDVVVAHQAQSVITFLPGNDPTIEGDNFFGNTQTYTNQDMSPGSGGTATPCTTNAQCPTTGNNPTDGTCNPTFNVCNYVGNELVVQQPVALAIGLFNNDQVLDVGIANAGTAEDLHYYASVIYGEFGLSTATADYSNLDLSSAYGDASSITFGKFNGNDPAFAILERQTARVRIMDWVSGQTVQEGNSTTMPANTYPVSAYAGDLDGDGNDDIAFGSWNPACDYENDLDPPECPCTGDLCDPVRTIHGGTGTPMLSGIITTNAGKAPRAVAMGDFNNDGNTDLAIANEWSNNVHVVATNSSGGFTVPVELAIDGSRPNHIAVGDFNGDGIDDIAVSQEVTNLVTILLSNP